MGYWERLDEERLPGRPGLFFRCAIGGALLIGAGMAAGMIVDAVRLLARLF